MTYKESVKLCFFHLLYMTLFYMLFAIVLSIGFGFLFANKGYTPESIVDIFKKESTYIIVISYIVNICVSQIAWGKIISKYKLKEILIIVTLVYSFLNVFWNVLFSFVFGGIHVLFGVIFSLLYPLVAAHFMKDYLEKDDVK